MSKKQTLKDFYYQHRILCIVVGVFLIISSVLFINACSYCDEKDFSNLEKQVLAVADRELKEAYINKLCEYKKCRGCVEYLRK